MFGVDLNPTDQKRVFQMRMKIFPQANSIFMAIFGPIKALSLNPAIHEKYCDLNNQIFGSAPPQVELLSDADRFYPSD
jgi:hypothetical protein